MIHKLLILFRVWLINNEPKFLSLLVNSPCSKATGSGIGECGDCEDGGNLESQGCSCFQKQCFLCAFILFNFGRHMLRRPPWLFNTGLSKETNEWAERSSNV